jgi:hypothetical protein
LLDILTWAACNRNQWARQAPWRELIKETSFDDVKHAVYRWNRIRCQAFGDVEQFIPVVSNRKLQLSPESHGVAYWVKSFQDYEARIPIGLGKLTGEPVIHGMSSS